VTIQRENLSDRVAQYICDIIEKRGLRQGDSLPSEIEVATELGVSRGIVREAFSSLAALGIIDVNSGKRARVSPIREDVLSRVFRHGVVIEQVTVEQILELRRAVECTTAAMAAERRTEEELAAIRGAAEAIRKDLENADAFVRNDLSFHLAIARAAHNPLIEMLITALRTLVEESIREGFLGHSGPEDLRRIDELHWAIVGAIADRDGPRAYESMMRHFTDAVDAVVARARRRDGTNARTPSG